MWTRPPGNNQAPQHNASVEAVNLSEQSLFNNQNQPSFQRHDFDAELQVYMGSKQHRDLLDRMHSSMRARYYAHGRMQLKQKVSIFTLSIISLFVVAISLFALTYSPILAATTKSAITFASIISSIFIIIVGLLESQNNYQVKALQMYKCAMEINDLYQKLQIEPMISKDTLQYYSDNFHSVMQGCPYSYDDIDFMMAKIEAKKTEDVGWETKFQMNISYLINVYGLNFTIMLIPPFILFFLL